MFRILPSTFGCRMSGSRQWQRRTPYRRRIVKERQLVVVVVGSLFALSRCSTVAGHVESGLSFGSRLWSIKKKNVGREIHTNTNILLQPPLWLQSGLLSSARAAATYWTVQMVMTASYWPVMSAAQSVKVCLKICYILYSYIQELGEYGKIWHGAWSRLVCSRIKWLNMPCREQPSIIPKTVSMLNRSPPDDLHVPFHFPDLVQPATGSLWRWVTSGMRHHRNRVTLEYVSQNEVSRFRIDIHKFLAIFPNQIARLIWISILTWMLWRRFQL